jgi:hypothetical protein
VRSIPSYLYRSILSIVRIFVLYKPLRFFFAIGTALLVPGMVIGVRFLVGYLERGAAGHIQSLILAAILVISAMVLYLAGVLADLIASNRVILEEVRVRLLRKELPVETGRNESGH